MIIDNNAWHVSPRPPGPHWQSAGAHLRNRLIGRGQVQWGTDCSNKSIVTLCGTSLCTWNNSFIVTLCGTSLCTWNNSFEIGDTNTANSTHTHTHTYMYSTHRYEEGEVSITEWSTELREGNVFFVLPVDSDSWLIRSQSNKNSPYNSYRQDTRRDTVTSTQ